MSTSTQELIERFYGAFAACDGAAMAACYGPDATFTDPVFVSLDARETAGMWRMLTSQASDLHIELLDHDADERRGTAHWQAKYTFSQTGQTTCALTSPSTTA